MSNLELISPDYYAVRKIQPIDIIESYNYSYGFCVGNMIKYLMRINFEKPKGEVLEDIQKAKWYLYWLMQELDGKPLQALNRGILYGEIRQQWKDILPNEVLKVLQLVTKVEKKLWICPVYTVKYWKLVSCIGYLRSLEHKFK